MFFTLRYVDSFNLSISTVIIKMVVVSFSIQLNCPLHGLHPQARLVFYCDKSLILLL